MFSKDHGSAVADVHGVKRSSKWSTARKEHLKIEPRCVACKKSKLSHLVSKVLGKVQVHHIIPFHVVVALGFPELELDQRNLITLCNDHHLVLGHLDDYQSYNPDVLEHATKIFFGKTSKQIESDQSWQAFEKYRPKDLCKMTEAEKAAIKAHILQKFGKSA